MLALRGRGWSLDKIFDPIIYVDRCNLVLCDLISHDLV